MPQNNPTRIPPPVKFTISPFHEGKVSTKSSRHRLREMPAAG